MLGLSAVEARTEVDATPEQVWDVISDPTTYPDWLVGAQRIRGVDPSFPNPGSGFRHSVGATKGTTIDDSTEATAAEAPYLLGLEVHAGPFRADVQLLVLPGPKGTEIRFSERPKGTWVALTPVLRPAFHARNAESLRRLEKLLEQRGGKAEPGQGGARAQAAAAAAVEEAKDSPSPAKKPPVAKKPPAKKSSTAKSATAKKPAGAKAS